MRRLYGAPPLHLLGHLALFALAGYALAQILSLDAGVDVLLWLVAAVLLHDLVLWPLYAALDAAGRRVLGRAVAFVRVPLALSVILALVYLPTLTGKGESTYSFVSGREWDGYVTRWLLVSAALFALSGAAYLLSRRRAR